VWRFCGLKYCDARIPHRRHRDSILLCVFNHLRAALQIPLPPGGNDLDVGLERVVRHLKPDLVITLAGGTMADGIGTDLHIMIRVSPAGDSFRDQQRSDSHLLGDLDLSLGDQGAGNGGT